jgi:hypothetical protein
VGLAGGGFAYYRGRRFADDAGLEYDVVVGSFIGQNGRCLWHLLAYFVAHGT